MNWNIKVLFCAALMVGTAGAVQGEVRALQFDGVNDYVNCGTGAAITGTGPFTVSAWVRTISLSNGAVIDQRDPYGPNGSYALDVVNQRVDFHVYNGSMGFNFQSSATVNDGVWHHIVGVRRNLTDGEIYIDGNLAASGTGPARALNKVLVVVGKPYTTSYFFKGLIDEVAIYNRGLSAVEILQMYQNGVTADQYLMAYWNFDEGQGQTAHDLSGRGNNGYLGSDPCNVDSGDPAWWVEPNSTGIYYVDGVGGSNINDGLSLETAFATIQMGINSAIDGDTVLVYPGIYNEAIDFMGKKITVQSGADAAIIEVPGDYGISFYTGEDGNSVLKNFVIRNCYTGIFIAGGSPTLTNLTIANNEFGITAYSGAEPNISNCIFWNNLNGDLFECQAKYSYVRDINVQPSGMVAHWKFDETSGTIAHDSAGTNNGTVYGATWTTGGIGGALNFDGINDRVDCGNGLVLYQVSIVTWIKVSNGSGQTIFSKKGASSGGHEAYSLLTGNLFGSAGIGTVSTRIKQPGYVNFIDLACVERIDDNQWHFIGMTYDGSTARIYIDGTQKAIRSNGSDITYALLTEKATIGSSTGTTGLPEFFFNGLADEVGIFSRGLTGTEVMEIYQNGLPDGESEVIEEPMFANEASGDYHLKSRRGRYWPAYDLWVMDKETSPCIDSGDPGMNPGSELRPNGGRINMGAYGGTAFASMSETELAGDLNHDGTVDMIDFALFAENWLQREAWIQRR